MAMSQSPLKISLSDFVFYRLGLLGNSLEQVFAFAKRAGFDGIELTESVTTRWLGSKRIRDISRHYDLPITSVHQSLMRMVLSTYGSVRRLMQRAEAVGAQCVVVHIASVHKTFQPDYFQFVKQMEQQYNIRVAFENAMSQFKKIKTPAAEYTYDPIKFVEFAKREDISVTYDLGHMAGLQPNLIEVYESIKTRLANIHLQDFRAGYDHQPLGTGDLPLPQFLQHLVQNEYKGLITLEVFPRNLRPFMSTSRVEEIMAESLQYFKTHTNTKYVNQHNTRE